MTQFTIPEGSGDVIASYVRQKAREWSVAQMVERVAAAVAELEAAARSIPAEHLDIVAEGEEWTPAYTIDHVTAINIGTATRCLAVATTGKLPAAEPAPLPEGRDLRLDAHRARLEAVFAGLIDGGPPRHLDVTWEHPFLGDLDWREWLLTLRVHSRAHAEQIAVMGRNLAAGR
jgi:hypothetical protein